MDIVIVSEFGEDYSCSDNDRFLYLAKMLSADNKVEIVTSSFRHTKKTHRREVTKKWPFIITFIDEPGYPKNVCLKRFRSHYVFGKNLLSYMRKREKPDVVFCAVPSLSGPQKIAKYCEKNNIRFVIDVQDLWPEAFQMVLHIPVVSSLLFAPFRILANGIYKRADAVCAVSDTYVNRALKVNKKCTSGKTVFLGTDISVFDGFVAEQSEKKQEEIRVAYCGTLGSSYDLTCVIDAISIINESRVNFVVMGDGPRMKEFKAYAMSKGISSEFTGRLPYDQMCKKLANCDIAVNPITHGAAQSIINKHADYVAAGLPIVSTQENAEFCKLIVDYQMGFNCINNDSNDVAIHLQKLIDNPSLRKEMGDNARKCAKEKFDRKETYKALEASILNDIQI